MVEAMLVIIAVVLIIQNWMLAERIRQLPKSILDAQAPQRSVTYTYKIGEDVGVQTSVVEKESLAPSWFSDVHPLAAPPPPVESHNIGSNAGAWFSDVEEPYSDVVPAQQAGQLRPMGFASDDMSGVVQGPPKDE